MALSGLVTESLERPVTTIRRYAISLAVAVVAAIAAILYAASALLLALESALGPIGARLTLAAVLLLIAVGGYFAPRVLRSAGPRRQAATSPDMEGLSRDQRLAMVFEALMLGFAMGSRRPADGADSGSK
jgi:hypothetical protein